jgi:hypothetical protein
MKEKLFELMQCIGMIDTEHGSLNAEYKLKALEILQGIRGMVESKQ